MYHILGFVPNITDPRNLSVSNYSDYSDSKIVYVEKNNPYDLGEISVFISAVLLSLGGFIAIIGSNIRRSRCSNIICGSTKCKRDVANDVDIGV
jgi:hypothetical protein